MGMENFFWCESLACRRNGDARDARVEVNEYGGKRDVGGAYRKSLHHVTWVTAV